VTDALSRGVARACLELADPVALRGRLEVLEREILAKAARFVQNFSLVAGARADGQQLALVSLTLDRNALEKALNDAGLRGSAAPVGGARSGNSVLVLVAEEASPGRPALFWWSETPGLEAAPLALARALAAKGQTLVEPKTLAGQIPPEAKQAALSQEQAWDLGRKSGASMLIWGRVRTFAQLTPPGQTPAPLAQLTALALPGGQVLARVEETGPVFANTPGPDAAQAVTQALEQAASRLLEKVAAVPAPAPPTPKVWVDLEVSGLRHLADRYRFEEVLGGLKALVGEMRMASVSGGAAAYRMRLIVPVAKLADELVTKDFGGFVVNVVESTPERLRLLLVPKAEGASPPAPAALSPVQP
jgi:hypothetical protein